MSANEIKNDPESGLRQVPVASGGSLRCPGAVASGEWPSTADYRKIFRHRDTSPFVSPGRTVGKRTRYAVDVIPNKPLRADSS